MARPTHVYTIDYVATLIDENLELQARAADRADRVRFRAHDERVLASQRF